MAVNVRVIRAGGAAPPPPSSPPGPHAGPPASRALLTGLACAVAALVCLLILLLVLSAWRNDRAAPGPPPDATDALSRATIEYERTLPDAYGKAEEGLRSGAIKTKAQLVAALAGHAAPLVKVMDRTFADFIDEKGDVTDPAKGADMMARVRQSLSGGKR